MTLSLSLTKPVCICLIISILRHFLSRLEIEREKAPFLRAMLKMEQNTTQNLARREKFFTDVSKTMEESEKK